MSDAILQRSPQVILLSPEEWRAFYSFTQRVGIEATRETYWMWRQSGRPTGTEKAEG